MGRQKGPELGRVTETSAYRKQHQSQPDLPGLQQASQKPQQPQALLVHSGPVRPQERGACPSYLSMASGSLAKTGQQQTQEEKSEESQTSKTEGLLLSRKTMLPSEVHHRERTTEVPWRGKMYEEQVPRIPGLSQAMEIKDLERGGHRTRQGDIPVYIHKAVEDTYKQPKAEHREAFSIDTGDLRNQAHDFAEGQVEGRVPVAQLRHSYMEGTTTTTTQASRRNKL